MKKIKEGVIKLWKDESGQGTAEYVLMLVVVLAVAFAFKRPLTEAVKGKMVDISKAIMGFTKDS